MACEGERERASPGIAIHKPFCFNFLCFFLSFFLPVEWLRERTRRNPVETMDLLFAKIKSLDPENASKIMGFLLIQDFGEEDWMRLAFSSDSILLSVVLQVKSQLGLPSKNSSAPSSPFPLNPIARPVNSNLFLQSSPRIPNNGFDFKKDPSPPSSTNCWSPHGFRTNPISPRPGSLLSYDNILAGSSQMQPILVGNNGGSDAGVGPEIVDDHQLNQYRSLLSKNSDTHLHRRSYSASDVSFVSEDEGFRTCLFFAGGFCKNGSNCKFVHRGLAGSADTSGEAFPVYRKEIMRLKAAQQQRASAGAQTMGEDFQKLGLYKDKRNEFFSMAAAYKQNHDSRKIYLTFPPDSTFKDEDVLEYFSKFGPVLDVSIPHQRYRMYGFVTFVYPETVKVILAKGNPHFLCGSRVLAKPYKDKGYFFEKIQSLQQQSRELGIFPQCLGPSRHDSRDPFDLNLGGKMSQHMQAESQHAVELQGRRLMNLHLPDSRNHLHHQHDSLSFGASLPIKSRPYIDQTNIVPSESNNQQLPEGLGNSQMGLWPEENPLPIQRHIRRKSEDRSKSEMFDINRNLEDVLPESDSNQISNLPTFQSDTPTPDHQSSEEQHSSSITMLAPNDESTDAHTDY